MFISLPKPKFKPKFIRMGLEVPGGDPGMSSGLGGGALMGFLSPLTAL